MSVVLSEHLPLLASAPDGIQKLRGLILELAVRGKLVPQDPKDEPVCELLKRIAKPRLLLDEDEQPFEIPDSWVWMRFESLLTLEYGDNLPAPKRTNTGEFPVYGSNGVVGTHAECCVSAPCIVVGRKGSAGALNLCLHPGCWVTDVAYYCVPPAEIDLAFCFKLFHTLGLNELGKGIKPGLSRSEAYTIPVAIPPLAEQHRIVAKVDELMALCDRLESEVGAGDTAHAKLVETLLGTLTQSTDAADLAANWQRLAEHFDTLFTTESSLNALKQTILQLAVMGKLVPQDPKDEPASELLKRIAKERARLEADGTCKKSKLVPPVGEDDQPFEVPTGWVWTRAAGVTTKITDGTHHTPTYVPEGIPFLSVKDLSSGVMSFSATRFISPEEHAVLAKRCNPEFGDILLTKVGTTGIAVQINTKRIFSIFVSVALLKLPIKEIGSYLELLINSPYVRRQSAEGTEGVGNKNLVLRKISEFVFPLPPLAEQHRIVAKVDELMALCDRLKADLADARSRQARLATTLIDTALKAA